MCQTLKVEVMLTFRLFSSSTEICGGGPKVSWDDDIRN